MITYDYIDKIIGECVEGIRVEGDITDIQQAPNGNYYVYANNTLEPGDVVEIKEDNVVYEDLIVLSATDTYFEISENIEFNTENVFVYFEYKPYYMAEKQHKANELLTEYDSGSTRKNKKYPLILLLRPYTEKSKRNGTHVLADLHLAIVSPTKAEWDSEKRHEEVIDPVLTPLFDKFLQALTRHPYISANSIDDLNIEVEVDCYIDGNPLPDKLDGLGVKLSELRFKRKCIELEGYSNVSVIINTDGDGTATPEAGNYRYEKDRNIKLVAEGGTDTFEKWVVNGVEYLTESIIIKTSQNINATAYFI